MTDPRKRGKGSGFTLIEVMVVLAILGIIAAIAIPSFMATTVASNEGAGSSALKALLSNESTWSTADLDQNGELDYWTCDIAGMYYMSPGATTKTVTAPDGTTAPIGMAAIGIKFLDVTNALADGKTGADYTAFTHKAQALGGYWLIALKDYQTGTSMSTTTVSYGVTNTDKYGFAAYPGIYASSGRRAFIISEAGLMWTRDALSQTAVWTTTPAAGGGFTSGVATDAYNTFPVSPGTRSTSSTTIGPWFQN